MVDIAAIAGALNSLKVAVDLTKGAISLRDHKLIGEALEGTLANIFEARGQALAAQAQISALLDSERELKRKLMELEEWSHEKQRYVMIEFDPGRIAYRIKETARGADPVHYACSACFQHKKISVMQAESIYGAVHIKCPECKLSVRTNQTEPFSF